VVVRIAQLRDVLTRVAGVGPIERACAYLAEGCSLNDLEGFTHHDDTYQTTYVDDPHRAASRPSFTAPAGAGSA
jgi:hypothetical protein